LLNYINIYIIYIIQNSKHYASYISIISFSIVTLSLLSLIIVTTWLDIKSNDNESNTSTFRKTILCFSVRRNFRNITQVYYLHPGLDSIHLLRFIFTILIIVEHFTLQYYANPVINFIYLEQVSAS